MALAYRVYDRHAGELLDGPFAKEPRARSAARQRNEQGSSKTQGTRGMPMEPVSDEDRRELAYHEAGHVVWNHRHGYPLRRGVTIDARVAECWHAADVRRHQRDHPPFDPLRPGWRPAPPPAYAPDPGGEGPCAHGFCRIGMPGCVAGGRQPTKPAGCTDTGELPPVSGQSPDREREARRRIGALLAGELAVRVHLRPYRPAEALGDIQQALTAALATVPGPYCDPDALAQRVGLLIDIALDTDQDLREPLNRRQVVAVARALLQQTTLSREDCVALLAHATEPILSEER